MTYTGRADLTIQTGLTKRQAEWTDDQGGSDRIDYENRLTTSGPDDPNGLDDQDGSTGTTTTMQIDRAGLTTLTSPTSQKIQTSTEIWKNCSSQHGPKFGQM